jgi:putative addiction module killer protein
MREIRRSSVYIKWLKNLRDADARARIVARVKRLAEGNPGDVKPTGVKI